MAPWRSSRRRSSLEALAACAAPRACRSLPASLRRRGSGAAVYLRAAALPVTSPLKPSFFSRGSAGACLCPRQLWRRVSVCNSTPPCSSSSSVETYGALTLQSGRSAALTPLELHAVGGSMMAIATENYPPSSSVRTARVAPGNLFRRMSAQAMGMEAAALCHRSHWVPKSSRSSCSNCRRSFRLWAGKHHCRLCGEIVCGACSTKRILFQKKSVRTCDDCVDANVQNISDINRRRSTPEFLRSNTSPAAIGDFDRYERRSLQTRPTSSRGLRRHHSSLASSSAAPPLGSRREHNTSNQEEAESSSDSRTVMTYRVTFSWQTQVMSLVVAALIVSIAFVLKLMVQV